MGDVPAARKSRTAVTTKSGWVWWAACLAPGDLDHAAVRQPRIEGVGGLPERRQALAAEQLEDRLADAAQRLERRGRVHLCVELAHDRRGRGDPDRPDRIGAIGRELGLVHPDDPGHERGQDGHRIVGREVGRQLGVDAGRVVARAGRRRGALVRDHPADPVRQERRTEGASGRRTNARTSAPVRPSRRPPPRRRRPRPRTPGRWHTARRHPTRRGRDGRWHGA